MSFSLTKVLTQMRRMTITLAFGVLMVAAGTAFAQNPPTQQPPPTQGAKPTTPPPAIQPPPGAQTPQTPATPPKLPAPVPFPADAKVAYVNLQEVVNTSKSGKSGLDDMKALNDKLVAAVNAKQKDVQAIQDKINAQRTVASDATLSGWAKDLDRGQRELEFMRQDAQVQLDQKQQDLLNTFQSKVLPIVEAIRNEKGLWVVFQIGVDNSPIIAAHAGLDLTAEVIKRLDSAK
jgi:outer membrane protein